MKKSMCCNEDMIFLGKSTSSIVRFIEAYIYCCSICGCLEWSTEKEKCKYKWYKYDREKLIKLLNKGE